MRVLWLLEKIFKIDIDDLMFLLSFPFIMFSLFGAMGMPPTIYPKLFQEELRIEKDYDKLSIVKLDAEIINERVYVDSLVVKEFFDKDYEDVLGKDAHGRYYLSESLEKYTNLMVKQVDYFIKSSKNSILSGKDKADTYLFFKRDKEKVSVLSKALYEIHQEYRKKQDIFTKVRWYLSIFMITTASYFIVYSMVGDPYNDLEKAKERWHKDKLSEFV